MELNNVDWESFGQNYRFIKELGSGGWGTVAQYEAKRTSQSDGENISVI